MHAFVGLVNYYRYMWGRLSHLLQPLTALTSTKVYFKWTDVKQQAFHKIRQIVTHETLLIYMYFNEIFDIHKDASYFQLVAVMSQNGKPIALYSRKLKTAKLRYKVTEN